MANSNKYMDRSLKEFRKIDKKRKTIIILILLFSFVAGILLPQIMREINQIRTNPKIAVPLPTPIPIPASLSLTSNMNNVSAGSSFSASLLLNSPNQGVEAADFVIKFDPRYLKVATVSSGNYFGIYPNQEVTENSVKISGLANIVGDKIIIPQGRGTVANIIFTASSVTDSTKIIIDKTGTVVASNGKNILDKTNDLTVKIY